MSTHEDRSRAEVEEILGLAPGESTAEADALVTFFSAASGPAQAGELPGEAAALAAFRAARPAPVPVGRRAKILATLTTLITVKTAAVALAATSVGGLAVAAGTGHLPAPLSKHSSERPTGGSADKPSTEQAAATALVMQEAAKKAVAEDRANPKSATASYAGQCKAFTAGDWDNARAAASPAFARLVAAAPNGDVAGFCQALVTEAATAKTPATEKGKSAEARENAADKGKSAENRDKTTKAEKAQNGKAKSAKAGAKKPEQAAENGNPNRP